jgi:Biopterin-dependent aromatic amino acid hydroxylase
VFDEGRLYAPITTADDGEVTVHLDDDHPGFGDPDYRKRRNLIAARALRWSPGEPIPRVRYTPEEHGVWQLVCRELAAKHKRLACAECRDAMARLGLPADRIPQLAEVGERLMPLTGFRYHPAAGLVGFEDFSGSLADGVFHSTQAKIFWFTIEFGVVWEQQELRGRWGGSPAGGGRGFLQQRRRRRAGPSGDGHRRARRLRKEGPNGWSRAARGARPPSAR